MLVVAVCTFDVKVGAVLVLARGRMLRMMGSKMRAGALITLR